MIHLAAVVVLTCLCPFQLLADDDHDNMTLAAAPPGCTSAAAHMSSFMTTSMEWDDETDWDLESDRPLWQGYRLVGMSDKDWAEDNIDMGDYPVHANEPPTISDKHIEGASGIVEVPTIVTHLPDPMHLSTPEESPHAGKDDDADKPISKEGATATNLEAEEEMPMADVVVEEEYFKQQEEEGLGYEDTFVRSVNKSSRSVNKLLRMMNKLFRMMNKLLRLTRMRKPLLWLGDHIDKQPSTDIDTGEATSLMESILGIPSPGDGHRFSEGSHHPHSQCSDRQHTVLSNYSQQSHEYSSDSSWSSSWSVNSSKH